LLVEVQALVGPPGFAQPAPHGDGRRRGRLAMNPRGSFARASVEVSSSDVFVNIARRRSHRRAGRGFFFLFDLGVALRRGVFLSRGGHFSLTPSPSASSVRRRSPRCRAGAGHELAEARAWAFTGWFAGLQRRTSHRDREERLELIVVSSLEMAVHQLL